MEHKLKFATVVESDGVVRHFLLGTWPARVTLDRRFLADLPANVLVKQTKVDSIGILRFEAVNGTAEYTFIENGDHHSVDASLKVSTQIATFMLGPH